MDFKRLLEDANFDTRPYSGRGMMGRQCVSINVDNDMGPNDIKTIVGIVTHLQESSSESELGEQLPELLKILRTTRTDSMGRSGSVLYWPTVLWPGKASSDEGDEDGAGEGDEE